MNHDLFLNLFSEIDKSSLQKLKFDLFEAALKYSNIRIEWFFAASERRIDLDMTRSIAHNSFIDCCNILSRNMLKSGESNQWRQKLGDNRNVIGDFACYLVCFLGVRAR